MCAQSFRAAVFTWKLIYLGHTGGLSCPLDRWRESSLFTFYVVKRPLKMALETVYVCKEAHKLFMTSRSARHGSLAHHGVARRVPRRHGAESFSRRTPDIYRSASRHLGCLAVAGGACQPRGHFREIRSCWCGLQARESD